MNEQVKLEAAIAVLRGYEQWEADIINCDEAWNTRAGHPWRTEELYDAWIALQHDRNTVLAGSTPVRAQWIATAERLPKPNTQVWAALLHNGTRYEVRTAFYRPDGYWDEFLADRITHWQPLYVAEPAAPIQP